MVPVPQSYKNRAHAITAPSSTALTPLPCRFADIDSAPLDNSDGRPSVTLRWDAVDVVVTVCPLVSVRISVSTLGEGVRVRIAVALRSSALSSGLYVLVARPVVTIFPGVADAANDALNVYEGVLYEGVEMRKFGSVVGTVADAVERKERTCAGVWEMAVAFEIG